MRTFAKNLKAERMLNGYTQKQLADKLGIPLTRYVRYEGQGTQNREPDLEMVAKISEILGCTTDDLLKK